VNPTCPYCRTEIGTTEGDRIDCPGCGTPHHSDCFQENGGCTVFGCSHAPVEEPKINVSGTDLIGAVSQPQTPAPGLAFGSGMFSMAAEASKASGQPPISAPAPPPPPPLTGTGAPPPPMPQNRVITGATPTTLIDYYPRDASKKRVVFVLLGIFLGMFGVHNFYAGYIKKGVFQLLVTLFTCFYGAIVSWIWAIVEICTINVDTDGVQFT
jgi:TM2 domain-containing membrane protein YozV